jgi:hypothetical protein
VSQSRVCPLQYQYHGVVDRRTHRHDTSQILYPETDHCQDPKMLKMHDASKKYREWKPPKTGGSCTRAKSCDYHGALVSDLLDSLDLTLALIHHCARCSMSNESCWCRRWRRVGCDNQRPECSKCTLEGLPCPGYSTVKPLIWRARIIQQHQQQAVSQPQLTFQCDIVDQALPSHRAYEIITYCQ